ncbi:MAG: hypothetical protein HS099_10075 [Ardenticatenaceae bacterium]|nr:hypothetical protein [Ardenticatenaceae bacterium]
MGVEDGGKSGESEIGKQPERVLLLRLRRGWQAPWPPFPVWGAAAY